MHRIMSTTSKLPVEVYLLQACFLYTLQKTQGQKTQFFGLRPKTQGIFCQKLKVMRPNTKNDEKTQNSQNSRLHGPVQAITKNLKKQTIYQLKSESWGY